VKALIMVAMLTFVLSAPAHAQATTGGADATSGSRGGAGGKHRNGSGAKTQEQKPKVDDKEYRAAIDRLPDQKFDPWKNAR
jgi:hypothetical protein